MPSSHRWGLAVASVSLVVAGLATSAWAHGGSYQPPPDPPPMEDPGKDEAADPPPPTDPPPPEDPGGGDPPATGGDDVDGPATGGDDVGGPATGGDDVGGPATGGDDGGGPATGGDDVNGPTTGGDGGGPTTGGGPDAGGGVGGGDPPGGPVTPGDPGLGNGPPVGPQPRRGAGATGRDHWSRWWYANRDHVLDLSSRAWAAGSITPSTAESKDALWRAQVVSALVAALGDDDRDIASGAAIAIGKAGDASHAPDLLRVLDDGARPQEVREAAALALGLLPVEETPTDAAVRVTLEHVVRSGAERNRLRGTAVYALGLRADPASVPFLLETGLGGGASWDVPAAGMTALGLCGQDMVRQDLEAALAGGSHRRKDRVRRVYAAHGLARLGNPKAIPALRKVTRDKDADVRRAVILALGALSNEADDETADLLNRIIHRDKDRACRNMAVLALARLGHAKSEASIRYAYNKGDSMHQPFAAIALGLLARRSGRPELVRVLAVDLEERANADLRGALAIAVGLARYDAAAPFLRRLAGERGDPELRSHAAVALGLMGDTAGAPVVLRKVLADAKDPVLKRETALALGLLGDVEAVRSLIDTIEHGDSVYVQGSAAVALGRIGGPHAGEALQAMLVDPKRPGIARAMAAVGLGLLLDRTEGRGLARLGADLNWYIQTATIAEILTIL